MFPLFRNNTSTICFSCQKCHDTKSISGTTLTVWVCFKQRACWLKQHLKAPPPAPFPHRNQSFVLFWNRQSDKHSHFTQLLARCTKVKNQARLELLSQALSFNSSLNYFHCYLCAQPSATPWMALRGDGPKEYNSSHLALYDGRLFAPLLSEVIRNRYNCCHCCL